MPLHATRCTGRQQEADPWLACTAVVGRAHGALKDASVLAPGGLSQEQSTRSPAGGQPEASLLTMPLTEVMEGWGLRGSQGAIRVTRKRNNGERETDLPDRPVFFCWVQRFSHGQIPLLHCYGVKLNDNLALCHVSQRQQETAAPLRAVGREKTLFARISQPRSFLFHR